MNRREIILKEIEDQPENPMNHYLLAIEERRDNNIEACISALNRLIDDFPDYHPSYYVLAEIYYQLDLIDEGTRIANLGIKKAKDLQLSKVLSELEQLKLLND